MRVAILGCGPAGLFAAHAAVYMGHEPFIYSVKQKSSIPGAVYLHHQIPEVTGKDPDGVVTFRREGTRDGYAVKVYGNAAAPVSWDTFPSGRYSAWSMMAAYDQLWDLYGSSVIDGRLDADLLDGLEQSYPLVISSIPARALCENTYHFFNGQQVWITNEPVEGCRDNEIIYNGYEPVPWYRTSRIFGYGATEYPSAVTGAFTGAKPTGTNCDCHPGIKRVGRFGQWRKGVLVHHAYQQAAELIDWYAGRGAVAL